MYLLLILAAVTTAFCHDPAFLREMPKKARIEYSRMQKKWDLSYTQLSQMVKKWAERHGVQAEMREYLLERERRDKQAWKKFLKLINDLPALGDELLSILEDIDTPLMNMKAEKDNFKTKYKSGYKVLRYIWKQFSDLEEDKKIIS
ncbi:unnamed protein product [Cylicocyclus nassatus]|uniref:SXP/RAL-2 family protein Ani s 5-like cation-binding domain-containing protein n=1 Tax=Cylicocyclus nassatus TaxID=53992 RepID=A0AA36M7B7_CYLNA|nr:unnamed protein product [Cylicocyclus nassatus]